MMRKPLLLATCALVTTAALPLVGAALAPTPGEKMAEAASNFLGALEPEERRSTALAWEDQNRVEWHFVPKERIGLAFKHMDEKERALAQALLKSGLSQLGHQKTSQIVALETVLAALENNPVKRDPELYYVAVFGTPAPRGTWGWRFEGHHVSLNFTVVKGTLIATTPSFFGANPAEVREGALRGRRVLRAEEDLGRALLLSFDEKRRSEVIFAREAPPDILTMAASKVDPLAPAGVAVKSFSPSQKELVRKLLREYAAALSGPLAEERLTRIEKAGFEKIHFAWAGGVSRGDPHYYRLQGPTFLIEYDNTQSGANHVHTVWRDFDRDFGRDLIREHLRAAAH